MTPERYAEMAEALFNADKMLDGFTDELRREQHYNGGFCAARMDAARQAVFLARIDLCHRMGPTNAKIKHLHDSDYAKEQDDDGNE